MSNFIPASNEINTPGTHPLTGEPVPKVTGLAPVCGGTNIASSLIFGQGRIYDLADNSGVRSMFAMGGVKTGCSTPQLAALGLMIISEERGHCICNYSFHTTVVMAPAERRLNEDWARFYDRDVDTLVRTAFINLGAAGDRRDAAGDLWLGFPRSNELQKPEEHANPDHPLPYPVGMRDAETGLWYRRALRTNVAVPLEVESAEGLGTYRFNADRFLIAGTDRPWLYASGYRGIRKATVRLNFLQQLSSTPTQAAITLDGKLEEPCWTDELRATSAAPASLPYTGTRVMFHHDAQNLYVGVQRPPMTKWGRAERKGSTAGFVALTQPWLKGNSAPTIDRLGRPQQEKPEKEEAKTPGVLSSKDNWWRLIITDKNAQKAVYLTVTPDGSRTVGLYDESKKEIDRTWNSPWQNAVVADEKALTIESAIPWALLEAAGLNTDALAVNFLMYDPGMGTEALTYLGFDGLNHCTNFTPLGLGKPAPIQERLFTVRLHFAEPDGAKPGQRIFDVKLQGQTVLKDFDVAKEAGVNTALVKEFQHVRATSDMHIELISPGQTSTKQTATILSAMEVFEERAQASK